MPLFLGASLPSVGADNQVQLGRVTLILPGPTSEFAEVGEALRKTLFTQIVPPTNRLLSAYVPAHSFLENGGRGPRELEVYAMVQVPREAEDADCTPQDFQQVLRSIGPFVGTLDAHDTEELVNQASIRLQSLGLQSIGAAGRPELLGAMFRKPNASGFAMLMAFKRGDHRVIMAGGLAPLRIKQRLIIASIFRRYESSDTMISLRRDLEAWSDAVLARNR